MAEFSKALVLDETFAADRLAKLRGIATSRPKDPYYIARQHMFFLLASETCKHPGCAGCLLTLAIASGLEQDLHALDQAKCEREEEIARRMWHREHAKVRAVIKRVSLVSNGHEPPDERAESLRRDVEEDAA